MTSYSRKRTHPNLSELSKVIMSSCNVKVIARFRPLNEREKKNPNPPGFELTFGKGKMNTNCSISIEDRPHPFTFDRIFPPDTAQTVIYDIIAKPCVVDVLGGYNATIFAYGQTGSGKTYSMFGIPKAPGIIPRVSNHIFTHIGEHSQPDSEAAIKASFMEIYKERIFDLLDPQAVSSGGKAVSKALKVRESPDKGVWVEGLSEEFVGCEEDIEDVLLVGEAGRSTAATAMNATSSRSHTIFVLTVQQKDGLDSTTRTGRLNLVDLAGSERVLKTNVAGQQLEEAKDINKSLSTLGKCIHALATKSSSGKNIHIPFRESQLTRILQDSLVGNTKTTLLTACSPAGWNGPETLSTLRFGASAKQIKTVVSVNKKRSVEELEAIVKVMQREARALRNHIKQLEKIIAHQQSPDWDGKAIDIPKLQAASSSKKKKALSKSQSFLDKENSPQKESSAPVEQEPRLLRSFSASELPESPVSPREEEWDAVQLKAKFERFEKDSQMQLEQLKVELEQSRESEKEFKKGMTIFKDKYDDYHKRMHEAQKRGRQEYITLEEEKRKKEDQLLNEIREADENLIVLSLDNERLDSELEGLAQTIKDMRTRGFEITTNDDTVIKVAPVASVEVATLEEKVTLLERKVRTLDERNKSHHRRVAEEKTRNTELNSANTQLITKNHILNEDNALLLGDKERLEKGAEKMRNQMKEREEVYKRDIAALEARANRGRVRIFKPVRKFEKENPYTQKVDLQSHISGLKKTSSNFLITAKTDDMRSKLARGELKDHSINEYSEAFQKLDYSNSGLLDFDELKVCLKRLNKPHLTPAKVTSFFTLADKGMNEKITFDEFIKGIKHCDAISARRVAVSGLSLEEQLTQFQAKINSE